MAVQLMAWQLTFQPGVNHLFIWNSCMSGKSPGPVILNLYLLLSCSTGP
jgi:hypothetical protein